MRAFIAMAVLLLAVVSCRGETVIVEVPADTPTPQPTYTPLPTLEPVPTLTALPTYTPYPTYTPARAYDPNGGSGSVSDWTSTGSWYRDSSSERELASNAAKEGFEVDAYVATLDSDPSEWHSDLYLSLFCIGGFTGLYF